MALVIAGGVVGICGDIVYGVFTMQAAGFMSSAASAVSNKTTIEITANNGSLHAMQDFVAQAQRRDQLAFEVQSVQDFAKMCTLLLIIAAFVVLGIMCARRVDSSLASTTARASAKAKHLRCQIVVTVAFVFITFLLRATFASFNAVSSSLQNLDNTCQDACSASSTPSCLRPYNKYTHMHLFLLYTPEFQILVVLISSPLALLVALWGMTSGRTLQAMRFGRKRQMESGRSMLRDSA